MVTKKQMDLDIDLHVFDESEWEFLKVDSKDQNFEYFKEVEDFNVQTPREHLFSILKYGIACGVLGTALVLGSTYLYYTIMKPHISTQEEILAATSDINVTLERVEGVQAGSDELISISDVLSNYFYIYGDNVNFSELNNYCMAGSNFATTEAYFRTNSKASYDDNDCYARELRCFSSYINLNRVNEVIAKDDTYYAYISVSVPDEENLTQYYNSYRYSMTKYFGMYRLDSANVARYLLDINKDGNLPVKDIEMCIKLCKYDNTFKIIDDSQLTSICSETINTSVANVCNILGSSLVTTQHG